MADAINTRLAALDAQREELSSQKRALITNIAISAEDRTLLNESYDKDITALNTQITKLTNDLSRMFFSPSAVTKKRFLFLLQTIRPHFPLRAAVKLKINWRFLSSLSFFYFGVVSFLFVSHDKHPLTINTCASFTPCSPLSAFVFHTVIGPLFGILCRLSFSIKKIYFFF